MSSSAKTGKAKANKEVAKVYSQRTFLAVTMVILMTCLFSATALASNGGRQVDTKGVPLYVLIEAEWSEGDGLASWTVWGPAWHPVIGGTPLTSCSNCLEIPTDYTFHGNGKVVHFDEVSVADVTATPQSRHVVLYDFDGDGTYVGSVSSWHYFPWWAEDNSSEASYFDRLDYEITFDSDGNMTHFYYLQYEYKKLK